GERAVDNSPVKVLYVAGLGRSGSTILANTLGQVEGFFSGGELNFIWKHALIENRLCGCGRPSRECPFWGPVFDGEFGGQSEDLAREMMRLQYSGARTRHIPLMLTDGGREKIRARLGKFLDNTGRLYKAIRSVSGSRVVVDTSKEPAYGYALGMVPGIDLRVLHLVRDPRAAAYSWAKKKPQPDSADREFMHQKTPAQSAVLWDAWNAAIEALWRRTPEKYLRLRYEDFIADPRASFEAMLKLVGEEGSELPLVGEREVKLGISHTVSGNPNRFDTGAVELKQDQAWTEKMSPRDQRLVTALTVPLLKRYHYPLA
ncbi:MAG: sulfotransferase, partial [Actinomycetota bacterium]|nr:sulfotransferase [Actinomycetota bacterium]